MQRIQVNKWGNSLGFRIPRGIAENMGIQSGDMLEISSNEGSLLIKKVQAVKKHYALAAILDSFSSSEQHPELDFGKPQGEEVW